MNTRNTRVCAFKGTAFFRVNYDEYIRYSC